MKPPVIVIPGITATSLVDHYPSGPESIWGLTKKDYERAALHPDDLRFERLQPAQVRSGEVFSIPYDQYVGELRHDLTPNREKPRPVFLYGYDWRHPLADQVESLAEFIEEVVARTSLLRHYAKDSTPYSAESGEVDLVGHSMGGLLIAGYLAKHPKRRVRKVITMGTPFGGSFEAVIQIITGTSGLGSGVPKSSERETARVTPALYHLLPEKGVAVEEGPSNLPDSLFDADLWQHGVLETIADHLKYNGLDPAPSQKGRLLQAKSFLQSMLDKARAFRQLTGSLDLPSAGLDQNDWLAIVGIGEETRVALDVADHGLRAGSRFQLDSLHRKNGYPMPPLEDGEIVAEFSETGDGTVPYWAAEPAFLPPCSVVCVSPDDFGYWEFKDKILRRITNLHSMLPGMNRVIKLSVQFLNSEKGKRASAYDGVKGRAGPGCLERGEAWDPPFVGLEEEELEG